MQKNDADYYQKEKTRERVESNCVPDLFPDRVRAGTIKNSDMSSNTAFGIPRIDDPQSTLRITR
jgi:hypothetical protein